MDTDLYYYLGFSHFLGIGPMKFVALIDRFGNVEKAYKADKNKLQEVIGTDLAEKFIQFRERFDPIKKTEELESKYITIIPQEHRLYPEQLRNIPDPPICIYVKGPIEKIDFKRDYFFAIVGTRKPTSYGLQIAKKFAFDLASLGCVIVSGMAIGIDTFAHRGALGSEGKTIAVLGCGVDVIYPAANRSLYEEILQRDGLIISEFPPGQIVVKGMFIARNRLISGLSKGVLVVEGARHSGSLITARFAAEQGKEVFAPPVPLTSEMSAAPNILLKEGAKLVASIEDILEELNWRLIRK